MKFDDILKSIGEFGPYQIKIYFMVCLIGIPVAMNQMGQVFYAANTDHWCAVAEWESNYDACSDLDGDEYMGCIHQYRNASIPPDEEEEDRLYAQCSKYDANYTTWADGYYAGDETTRQTDCDEGWIYDKSEYTRTIKTDVSIVGNIMKANKSIPQKDKVRCEIRGRERREGTSAFKRVSFKKGGGEKNP